LIDAPARAPARSPASWASPSVDWSVVGQRRPKNPPTMPAATEPSDDGIGAGELGRTVLLAVAPTRDLHEYVKQCPAAARRPARGGASTGRGSAEIDRRCSSSASFSEVTARTRGRPWPFWFNPSRPGNHWTVVARLLGEPRGGARVRLTSACASSTITHRPVLANNADVVANAVAQLGAVSAWWPLAERQRLPRTAR